MMLIISIYGRGWNQQIEIPRDPNFRHGQTMAAKCKVKKNS